MTSPVRFLAFDLLRFGAKSLLREPYEQRRCLLAGVAMPDPHQISALRGFTFTELAADRRTRRTCSINVAVTGHESLVAKLLLAPDVPGRSPDVLVQARPGAGQNRLNGNVGGLLLGSHDPNTGDPSPGRRDALLRPAPLRTVRASRRCTRLKQAPWGDSGLQSCWFFVGAGCPALQWE